MKPDIVNGVIRNYFMGFEFIEDVLPINDHQLTNISRLEFENLSTKYSEGNYKMFKCYRWSDKHYSKGVSQFKTLGDLCISLQSESCDLITALRGYNYV